MAKIPRSTQLIFGSGGNVGAGGFGAAAQGNLTTELATSSTLAAIMGNSNWAAGWSGATLGASKFPAVEDMNALSYAQTVQLAYLFQAGIAEYDSGTTYFIGSLCLNPGTFQLYGSLTNANVGNALNSAANWQLLVDFSNFRQRLTANTSYYVATTGNDSTGNGTSGAPWATIQHAINYIQQYVDINGYAVSILVADGIYTTPVVFTNPFVGAGNISLIGDNTTPDNCIISTTNASCISVNHGQQVAISGFKFTTTTAGNAINCTNYSTAIISSCDFAAVTSSGLHMNANGGQITIGGNYKISGLAGVHIIANGGFITYNPSITVTLSGTPTLSTFADATNVGVISCTSSNVTFSGSSIGNRYSANANGVIETAGSGATFFPGNAAGATTTGGQYI